VNNKSSIIDNGHNEPHGPLISVIIVTYNNAACLRPTLDAVFAQNYPQYEIILVDNASQDESLVIAREYTRPNYKIIANATNRGFAGGNNDAVAASRGEIVFLVNPDAILEPTALTEVARAFAERPDLGILGAKLMAADGKTILHCGGHIDAAAHTALYGIGELDQGQRDEIEEVDFVIGAAYALRRELWDRLGGFDEDFNPCYYEDTDQCLRCRRMSYKVLYWPRLRVIHPDRTQSADFAKSAAYQSPTFWWYHHRHRLWFQFKNASLLGLLFRVIPAELRWYFSAQSAGLRKFMLKIYYYTLRRYVARKILRIPAPGARC